jgi:hypothetical protein
MRTARRRTILKVAGVAAAGLTAAGVWRAWDQGVFSSSEGPAYAPWETWRSDAPSPVHRMVRAAVLAANPHNSQPWRFRVTATSVDLFADHTRNIGAIDPYLREMHVGLGCALENLLLSAPASGFGHELEAIPLTWQACSSHRRRCPCRPFTMQFHVVIPTAVRTTSGR